MSARDKIAGMFPGKPHLGLRVADEILAEHAHELAEKIRHAHAEGGYKGWPWEADLIDPVA